jgi:pimeloyl-ACP methyl ester carboxylesterase
MATESDPPSESMTPSASPGTWVLLRGLTREAAHWGSFPAVLSQAVPGARVVLLDLPGNGALHHQRSPTSIAALLAACRAELTRRGDVSPFYLLAMSMGAMVAAEWARTAPQELAGAVLVNTSMRPFSPFFQRLRPRNYGSLLRLAWPGPSSRQIEQTVLQLTSNRADAHAPVVSDWVAVRQQRPVSTGNALRQLLAAARYRYGEGNNPRPPTVPVLLLASAQDGLVSAACSLAIAQAWGAALALHPQAGHDLPLDDPQWVAAQVRDWLDQRPATPPMVSP